MTASRDGRRGWLLLLAVAGGVFVAADDQTSVVTVLPAIIQHTGITVDDFYRSSWIVNGYLLGYLVALPVVGRVADLYGHGRVYAAALVVFMLGSALVALSPTFELLVASRALQAVGGGAVVPVAMAIVVRELPARRRVLGLGAIAAASEAGALIGPLWGGAITEWFGWRWVFWINLPMALPVLIAVWGNAGVERRAGRIDWPGAGLLAAALAVLTFALVDDPLAARPAAATAGLGLLVAALFAGFVLRERRAAEPMLRLALFRPTAVRAANAASLLAGGGLIGALIGVPLFVNLVLLQSPLDGGLTLLRLTVAVPVGALLGGWLASRLGLRVVALAGCWLAAGGFAGLATWGGDLAEPARTAPQLIAGLGFGLVIAPLSAAVMQYAGEAERATAAAWLTLSRVVGMLLGAALLTSRGLGRFYGRAGSIEFGSPEFGELVQSAQVSTFHEVFAAAAVVMVVAGALAWFVGRGEEDGVREPWWTVT